LGGIVLAALLAASSAAQDAGPHAGESIYRDGMRPSGEPVTARRDGAPTLRGAEAACSNCHRRSGLGQIEGKIAVPPISGLYLYHARSKSKADLDIPYVEGMRTDRDPYTDDSLARAIRDGVGVDGAQLDFLMPRYDLGAADLQALISYMKQMAPPKVPGVSDIDIQFATVTTPDADPVKREAVLNVLRQYFADENAFAAAERPLMPSSQGSRMRPRVHRRWQLHVWTLTGAPAAWEEELRQHLAQEPVFAVISGVGGANWQPVHRFCERYAVPCLFPNVDLPVVAERDFYPLYFSRGVLLEAQLLARRIANEKSTAAPRRLVQVFRTGDVGEQAAKALHAELAGSGVEVVERPLRSAGGRQPAAAVLDRLGSHDMLMLWLRRPDILQLPTLPARVSSVFMSGLMGGLEEAPLPPAWRPITHMAYPFDLPDRRTVPTDYALGWFTLRHIPVVAEQAQIDTYLACSVLSDTVTHIGDLLNRDYLIETLEHTLDHRVVNGYYPRLSLAPNERFASKGGYFVHFAGRSGSGLVPETEWLTP
jgi:hypothetical protein